MVHCQLRSLFAATASQSITSRPSTGNFGSRGHGHCARMRGINLENCSSSTPVQILVTQTLAQTPEPKFSPNGSSAEWSGGRGSRRIEEAAVPKNCL